MRHQMLSPTVAIADLPTLKAYIKAQILNLADKSYANFSRRITPTAYEIVGVRVPLLRKLAKNIAKSAPPSALKQYFHAPLCENYEQIMLLGMLLGIMLNKRETHSHRDFSQNFADIKSFLPFIDNWAICDTFCAEMKDFVRFCATKSHNRAWDFAFECTKDSKNPFTQRFGLVIMLLYFVDKSHIEAIFDIAKSIHSTHYYVNMANAWLVSVCFVKFPAKTRDFLAKKVLNQFTQNKAISKICDSLRVDSASKAQIKTYKIA